VSMVVQSGGGHGHCRDTPRGIPLPIDVSFIFQKRLAEVLTEAGWKSDIEKQIFLSDANRPEGVNIWEGLCVRRVVWLIFRAYLDPRWFERVFCWKHQNPMVLSSFER